MEPMSTPVESFGWLRRVTEMVERSSGPAFATDQDNRLVAFNARAEEVFTTEAETAVGRKLARVLVARDVFGNRLCDDACGLHAMVHSSEPVHGFELDLEPADGRKVRVAVSVVVVLSARPERYGLVYFLRPRLRRRKADEAIERLLAGNGRPAFDLLGEAANGAELPDLTERQVEILRRIAAGSPTRDIADHLHISVNTVRNHTQNILRKLSVHSKTEAVSVALRQRLI